MRHFRTAQSRVASDPGRKVQKDLDIAGNTDPEHNPMIPHVTTPELKAAWDKGEHGRFYPVRQDLRAGFSGARVIGVTQWTHQGSATTRQLASAANC